MTMKCKRCQTRPAQPATQSVVILCARCAYEVSPGPDVAKFLALVAQFGR